ncbi:MAG: DUF2807 domain-containing protein [Chitinophagaceae bacterium]|nr:DUF2807 domain-containing protein [Chitinophagaceae bacterium]
MKYKVFLPGLFLVSTGLLFFSCSKEKIAGSGNVISETRNAQNFYSVSASGSANVIITYGNAYSVSVKGFENILPKLQTYVENGVLIIKYTDNTSISNDNSEVDITMPSLVGVSNQGASQISITGNFIGMDNLTVSNSGPGNIVFSNGSTTNLALNLSGSGDVLLFGLSSQNAIVKNSGGGNAEVSVSKSLKVTISGSGNVFYKGNPAVDSSGTGTGQVIQK